MCAKESVIWVPHVTVWTETWGRMDGNLGKQTECLRDNYCYIIVVNIPSVLSPSCPCPRLQIAVRFDVVGHDIYTLMQVCVCIT
ncbi:MAG: hypothetical protein QOH35_2687 [Acidobacteriaceae bacterium]|jgi:hypothetical protein|nr:hypothetical protein [Acidobacteriaceae bacterium]